jgi:hypothetical protein
MQTLSKARFILCNASGAAKDSGITCQFNPASLKITHKMMSIDDSLIEAAQSGGIKYPVTLTGELFFNTLETSGEYSDVSEKTIAYNRFFNTEKNADTKWVLFAYGSLQILGIMSGFDVNYTCFAPSGIPVRATADFTIEGKYYKK